MDNDNKENQEEKTQVKDFLDNVNGVVSRYKKARQKMEHYRDVNYHKKRVSFRDPSQEYIRIKKDSNCIARAQECTTDLGSSEIQGKFLYDSLMSQNPSPVLTELKNVEPMGKRTKIDDLPTQSVVFVKKSEDNSVNFKFRMEKPGMNGQKNTEVAKDTIEQTTPKSKPPSGPGYKKVTKYPRNYPCPACPDRAYTSNHHLKEHILKQHKGTPLYDLAKKPGMQFPKKDSIKVDSPKVEEQSVLDEIEPVTMDPIEESPATPPPENTVDLADNLLIQEENSEITVVTTVLRFDQY